MKTLRRAMLARLIIAACCWALFFLDLGGYLIYFPSGRGPTDFEQVGHAILLPGMLLLGSLFTVTGLVHAYRYSRCRARQAAGRCWRCGYDLRATPQQCPECGIPATPNDRGT